MNETVIRVHKLGKRYRIGRAQGYKTIRESIAEAALAPMRLMRRRPETAEDVLWALRDVSFEIHRGEVVGIMGGNGAGKSTLLKILSRITEPSTGYVEIEGRIGSLLEVGTGFHPELTGRENIFMNGAILGMSRYDIRRRFDEIVAFAEVEKFLDMPVKRYSSGMYTRLAFAVAAHMETDILVVDEVLAVGDAQFQKKCVGKMGDIARHGRTVLFVSHNMAAVVSLCTRGILLRRGELVMDGTAQDVSSQYQASFYAHVDGTDDLGQAAHYGTGKARFTSMSVTFQSSNGTPLSYLQTGGDIRLRLEILGITGVEEANVCVVIYDATGYRLVDVNTALHGQFLTLGAGRSAEVTFDLHDVLLKPGTYMVGLWLGRGALEDIDGILYARALTVEPDPKGLEHTETFPGAYQCRFTQEIHALEKSGGPTPDLDNALVLSTSS